jgi:hypothetical protein
MGSNARYEQMEEVQEKWESELHYLLDESMDCLGQKRNRRKRSGGRCEPFVRTKYWQSENDDDSFDMDRATRLHFSSP